MGLNRLLAATLLLGVLPGAAWLAQDAEATFASSPGFSGRAGATCVSCHTLAPFPLTPPAASAEIDGLPAEWDAGQTYRITVRVTGGPEALPPPAPQGGFDLSIDGGTFSIPQGSEALLTIPNAQEITYRPDGTLMREWQVDWTAPELTAKPTERKAWLAVLSANGNHVIATNASDGGERFDSAANLTAAFPPSQATAEAWRAMPLLPPTATANATEGSVQVEGRHADGNATRLWWRLDGGDWQDRETGAGWRIRFDGLDAGSHTLDYRSEGEDRRSPDQALRFTVPGFAIGLPGDRDSPAPGAVLLLALFAFVAALRNRP
ncbi:MAG TPA: choice-of-anchor V domain-containing protein [Candidatus Thermoplasmatota archaeon]|nr:choice-of-anchor V domain-containing protein [Candidatus Thermoplasmatota archaeon]